MQKVLSRVIFIGFSIQIVLGILWMCNAFAGFINPGEGIVCVGFTALVGAVTLFMKQSFWGKGKFWEDGFLVLSVLTFPFVMQCFVNPDYRLWIVVFMLLGTGCVIRIIRKIKGVKTILVVLCFWLISAGVIMGMEGFHQGWISISTRFTERIVWTNLYRCYARLPEEYREPFDYDKLVDSTYEVGGLETIFVPYMIETMGEQKTNEILADLRTIAWQYEKKQIVKEIVWDAAGYAVSPIVLPLQLEGRAYESYSGMNYRELLQPAPKLGKLYTTYSCWWFAMAFMLGAVICVVRYIKKCRRIPACEFLVVILTMVGMVAGYTLNGAGRMDYKNTLFVLCIWLVWMSGMAIQALGEERLPGQSGGDQDEKE